MGTKSTFKKDVAIQAILYAAQNVDRKDIHKICKILYFADSHAIWTSPIECRGYFQGA